MKPQLLAQYYDDYHMMGGGNWGWGAFMFLMMIVMIAAITLAVIAVIHWQAKASEKK